MTTTLTSSGPETEAQSEASERAEVREDVQVVFAFHDTEECESPIYFTPEGRRVVIVEYDGHIGRINVYDDYVCFRPSLRPSEAPVELRDFAAAMAQGAMEVSAGFDAEDLNEAIESVIQRLQYYRDRKHEGPSCIRGSVY